MHIFFLKVTLKVRDTVELRNPPSTHFLHTCAHILREREKGGGGGHQPAFDRQLIRAWCAAGNIHLGKRGRRRRRSPF